MLLKTYLPFVVVGAVLVAAIAYLWRELQKARKALDGFAPTDDAPPAAALPVPPAAKRQRRVRFAPEVEDGSAARSFAGHPGGDDLDEDLGLEGPEDPEGLEDLEDLEGLGDAPMDEPPAGDAEAAAVGPATRAPR